MDGNYRGRDKYVTHFSFLFSSFFFEASIVLHGKKSSEFLSPEISDSTGLLFFLFVIMITFVDLSRFSNYLPYYYT
jgi:hypothetical protein